MPLHPKQKPAKPFGSEAPFDPTTGARLAVGDASQLAVMTVQAIGHDVLVCTYRQVIVFVAKPDAFRKSLFDGKTVEGVARASLELDVRTAQEGVDTAPERITPPYRVGDKILAGRVPNYLDAEIEAGARQPLTCL